MHDYDLKPASELRTRLRFQPDSGQIWLDQQRMIMIHAEAMGELRRELIDTLGHDRARGVLTRMGYASGIRDARFARRLFPTASDNEVFLVGPQLHNLEGIVNVRPVRFEMNVARGICEGEFIWESSFEAEVHRRLYGIDTDSACWMQIGYATGYTSELYGQMVLFREVECTARGDRHCRIVGRPAADWPDAERDLRYFRPESLADRLLELQNQVEQLRASVREEPGGEVIGESVAFKAAQALVEKVAASPITVMLLGETGVGKELFAHEIHRLSTRCSGPFVAVNCAAIPEELIESELFGVEKGAFTGASRSRPGRFERAHGGTLFLDEVGELSAAAQAKLLRVLQEGEIERIGDTATRRVDVRVVVATNIDLEQAVAAGRFRADLFYRLNSFPVHIPPLRERLADVPALVRHFVQRYSVAHGKRIAGMSEAALAALTAYDWPGNIRELKNIVERGVILTPSDEAIDVQHLFPGVRRERDAAAGEAQLDNLLEYAIRHGLPLEAIEARLLDLAVERARGNLSAAARQLGMTRPQLAYRLKKHADRNPTTAS
ncbi:MAG: sigma 54-interacting transcriptional regulator [Gammaproteobacteria bacterium]